MLEKIIPLSQYNTRHCKDREPPLPLYVGLNVHTLTRNKKIVNILYKLGVSVSCDRIIEVENSIASAICKRFREENLVYPVNLRTLVSVFFNFLLGTIMVFLENRWL